MDRKSVFMSVLQLQNELIRGILATNDQQILQAVQQLLFRPSVSESASSPAPVPQRTSHGLFPETIQGVKIKPAIRVADLPTLQRVPKLSEAELDDLVEKLNITEPLDELLDQLSK